jgi:hypothetical protein
MQHVFLRYARPLAPATAALVYLVAPSRGVRDILFVLLASVGAGITYLVASRIWSSTQVLRVALPLDTLLIAAMTVSLGRTDSLALA